MNEFDMLVKIGPVKKEADLKDGNSAEESAIFIRNV